MGGSAGALWWKAPVTFSGRLYVVLDFSFVMGSTAGDGITVAWIPTTKLYTVGPEGQSYGICNAGLAVATLPSAKKVTVDITTAKIKASLDIGVAIQRATISPTTGYLGFTAATADGFTSHIVTGVSASICP